MTRVLTERLAHDSKLQRDVKAERSQEDERRPVVRRDEGEVPRIVDLDVEDAGDEDEQRTPDKVVLVAGARAGVVKMGEDRRVAC